MAMTTRHKIVSSKIDLLTEQRNNLQTSVDEINEILQLSTSWLENADSNNFTFNEINKMIEDKLVFVGNIDFTVQENEQLQKFEQRLSALEKSIGEISLENGKLYQNIKMKLDNVCNQMDALLPRFSKIETPTQKGKDDKR